jgi:hypothetical protein
MCRRLWILRVRMKMIIGERELKIRIVNSYLLRLGLGVLLVRWRLVLQIRQAEMFQNFLDDFLIIHESDDTHLALAVWAGQGAIYFGPPPVVNRPIG